MTAPSTTALVFVLLVAPAAGALPATAQSAALPEPVHLSGTVADETGGMMRSVIVRVFREGAGDPPLETTTDGNGRFSLHVPAGAYRVEVAAPSFRTVERTVRAVPGLEPLAITLALDILEEASTSSTRRTRSASTPCPA